MVTSFVPLRLRSRHSRLAGTIPVGELARHVKDLGFEAAALVDTGNLYGAVEFYEACRDEGIRPIIGAELVCPGTGKPAVLVALTRQGYANLCRIISDVNLEADASLVASLRERPEGLAALSSDIDLALNLTEVLGPNHVWVDIVANRHGLSTTENILRRAGEAGLKAVGSWEVLFLEDTDERVARVLKSIATGGLMAATKLGVHRATLRECAGLGTVFDRNPELLAETRRLARMVDLSLDLGKPHFPQARSSSEEAFACLEKLCRTALGRKYRLPDGRMRRRLRHELEVIRTLGLADYFLVVKDIVDFAASRSIPATGRGSGAGSLVAYVLDITQVDPIEHGLIFERFLNEHRPDYPDLDIDFSWRRRDEVIDFVYDHFGRSRVAMISTHACFETRSAAREVAKAFGLSPYEAQSLASRLPRGNGRDMRITVEQVLGEIRPELPRRCRRTIGELAASVTGLPHHTSVHCGGIVIADGDITDYTPLELASKGIQVTQFDMHSVEKMGLIKIDLLGNRGLTVIEEATRAIRPRHGSIAIRSDDPATAALMSGGKTLSCFQLESPAMRSLLRMLEAKGLDDATLALALVRPGPSAGGMKDRMVRDRRRARGARNGHPVESSTTGAMPVYQEDIMRIISRATGTSLAEADIIRREVKERTGAGLERKFLFLAQTAGVDSRRALRAWHHVKRFAAYSFCKAHAASYGTLAYSAAYLKANFPLEFYAAVLRNHAGMYPLWVHTNEARRFGVTILLPSVNRSQADFTIEDRSIRTGLSLVKHLSAATLESITSRRKERPFTSLTDFLSRVPANRDETISLIAAGALDGIEPERCRALAAYLSLRGRAPRGDQPTLGLADCGINLPTQRFSELEKRRLEYDALGISPLVHPLVFFGQPQAPAAKKNTPETAACGLVAATRHYRSERADLYFLTLDHPDGLIECIVPRRDLRHPPECGKACVVRGRPQNRFGVRTLRARSMETLPEKSR
jgi:DNA polymerase-3 subunit alpha